MNSLKQKVLSGWNWVRVMYVIMGTVIIIQSIIQKQWLWVLFGAYFASMGLFGFGCAAGACFTNMNYDEPADKNETKLNEVRFEEIKEK
jgi:hypothetical protein